LSCHHHGNNIIAIIMHDETSPHTTHHHILFFTQPFQKLFPAAHIRQIEWARCFSGGKTKDGWGEKGPWGGVEEGQCV